MINTGRQEMKMLNRGTVLRLISTGRCSSRIELSREMGLTKTAISKIVAELIDSGYLIETAKQDKGELGRSPIGLDIAPTAPIIIGVLIMRDYCEAVLCNMKLDILSHRREYREWSSSDELMETVYSLIDQLTYGSGNIGGIGVAAIGPLDSKAGIIEAPPYFRGIHDVHIKELLESRYALPVCCDNDNQSAALAEKLFGCGRDCKDILLIGIANGIGCGIVTDGEKYGSSSGYTPEIGHLSIDYNGEKCVCGNKGCLELYINSVTVLKRMRAASGKFYDYKTFCELDDEPHISAIFEDLIDKLSVALVSAVNILNPEIIIIGHNGVWWPDRYLTMLEEEINTRKFSNHRGHIRVMKAQLGERTAVLGGACNLLIRYFNGDLIRSAVIQDEPTASLPAAAAT